MFLTAYQLKTGRQYKDETGERCILARYREWSTQSEGDCEPVVVFLESFKAVPLHLVGSLVFIEIPAASAEAPGGRPRAGRRTESAGSV